MIDKIIVTKMIDPLVGNETTVIYLKNQEWIAEDVGNINEKDPLWKNFLKFMEKFFRNDNKILNLDKIELSSEKLNDEVIKEKNYSFFGKNLFFIS